MKSVKCIQWLATTKEDTNITQTLPECVHAPLRNGRAAMFAQGNTRSQSVRTLIYIKVAGHLKDAEEDKVMVVDCLDCLHAKIAKKREEIAAVHIAVDNPKSHSNPTSNPNPTKKISLGRRIQVKLSS